MKMMKYQNAFLLIVLVVFTLVALVSCQEEGVSKEERIAMFKTDILSDSNPREHFEGRTFAGEINHGTFDSISWSSDYHISFPVGELIGDTTFTIYYDNDDTTGTESATGEFYKVAGSSSAGDVWYILFIEISPHGEIPSS